MESVRSIFCNHIILKALPLMAGLACTNPAWAAKYIIDLGTLGGDYTSPTSTNNHGQVVGYATTQNNSTRAFIYSDGSMTTLGTLGGDFSVAESINDKGQVVGNSSVDVSDATSTHAFLYNDGKMLDLNYLLPSNSGWRLSDATDINDLGQIIGYGYDSSGTERAFLMSVDDYTVTIPTPLPATVWLFCSGLLGLAGIVRKRKIV